MRRAFTLVELLVVIAIIGLLSTIAVVSLGTARSKARDTKRLADIRQIRTAMQLYLDANGTYPNTGNTGIGALNCPDGATGYYCLGHGDAGTCAAGAGYHGCTALDNALSTYIAKIPDDPENNTAYYGDAYLYVFSGTLSTATAPFLSWGMDQQTNANVCMGGAFAQWDSAGRNRWWCASPLP